MTQRLTARERRIGAWKLMRSLQTFTADDVIAGSKISYESAHSLLRKLESKGVIKKMHADDDLDDRGRVRRGDGSYRETGYRLIWDKPRMPRAVDRTYYWQLQAWTTMRVKARFTATQLIPAMEEDVVSDRSLRRWCKQLADAGYLRIAGSEGASHEYIYQLVRNEGPQPPIVHGSRRRREARNEC